MKGYSGDKDKTRSQNIKNYLKKESFEVFVSEVVSPWEFYSQKTDPLIISRLEKLNRDINQYCTKVPINKGPLPTGSSCCVKFTADNLWYRGIVLENLGQACLVRQVDFGNSEVIPWSSVLPMPPQFQTLDSVSFRCCLADIRKTRKGRDWDEKAKKYFEVFKFLECFCYVY